MKPRFTIELDEMTGLGLVIACQSGVTYTNQVGGYACRHPEIEGVFVPLPASISAKLEAFFTGPKWNGRCFDEIDDETANFVDSILQTPDLGGTLCVDRECWSSLARSFSSVAVPACVFPRNHPMNSEASNGGGDSILFECQTCREEPCAPHLNDLSAWAKLCGYDSTCVRLCAEFDELQSLEIQNGAGLPARYRLLDSLWAGRRNHVSAVQPPFLESPPEPGRLYIACVSHPFITRKAEPFWFLFQPPFTLLNGWDEHPEEIYASRLLHAVFDRVLHRERDFALIVVTIREVLHVAELHERFAETQNEKVLSMLDAEFARRAQWVRWLNYVYVFWNLESDVGVWWLFRQDKLLVSEPVFHLVMQGHWGWHDALVWAGNQRLSDEEAARLHSFLLR